MRRGAASTAASSEYPAGVSLFNTGSARASACTTSASNCVPECRHSSVSASAELRAGRYALTLVIASNASATWTILARSGVSSRESPCG